MTAPTPGLIIHGTHAGDTWIENAGELVCLDRRDITRLHKWVTENGVGTIAGITLDESDLTELAHAPELFDCAHCEGPALINIEGRIVCPGHAAGFGFAEEQAS